MFGSFKSVIGILFFVWSLLLAASPSGAMGSAPKKEPYKLEILKMEVIPAAAFGKPAAVGAIQEIKLTAKRYEYVPGVIEVKTGIPVRLVITSEDVTHGFDLEAFKREAKIEPGKNTVIEFTPDKAGEFPFYCNNFCGLGHGGMRGKLIVR